MVFARLWPIFHTTETPFARLFHFFYVIKMAFARFWGNFSHDQMQYFS